MGVGSAATRARDDRAARAGARELTPTEAAWLAVVPCALVTLAAVLVLGPVLGHALLEPSGETIYPGVAVRPEPVEHGRYFVALLGPLLLAAIVVTSTRRAVVLPATTIRALVTAGQALTLAFVLACLLAQYGVLPGSVRQPWSPPTRYFRPPTLAIAATCSALLLAVLRNRGAVERFTRWTRETVPRRVLCAIVAALFLADWLLRAVHFERTIALAHVPLNLIFWQLNESFAVLEGRTPLVDYHTMYGHLWSYVGGGAMAVAGASVGTWTITMATISGLALFAVYAVLRRIAGSSLLALALFLPFVAIGFWVVGSPSGGTSQATVFSIWPLRYAGPYLLAWLTARHLDGAAPRRAWALLGAATLVLINNLEFGIGAFAATLAALALGPPLRSRRARARLAASTAAGVAAAVALVSALTLVRAGELPRPGIALEFPRLFGIDGWGLEPMPVIGLHLAMYTTFGAAIVVAVVRAIRDERQHVLTGMLGWAGVFGLLAGTYYMGRSDPANLKALLSTWSFALALLLVAIVRDQTARPGRPALLQAAVTFAFALAVASLADTLAPWSEIARLQRTTVPVYEQPAATRFIAVRTRPGEHVAILAPLGSRIAYELHLVNVSPYASVEAMRTPAQVRTAVEAVQREHAHRVFIKGIGVGEESGTVAPTREAFEAAGFALWAREPLLIELVDRVDG